MDGVNLLGLMRLLVFCIRQKSGERVRLPPNVTSSPRPPTHLLVRAS